jgi:hypothetical protein
VGSSGALGNAGRATRQQPTVARSCAVVSPGCRSSNSSPCPRHAASGQNCHPGALTHQGAFCRGGRASIEGTSVS